MTNNSYAIIDSENKAKNFILWDGISEYSVPDGHSLILIPENISYRHDWVWDGTTFIEPPAPPPIPPESITRRQCAMQMFITEMITGAEAIAMTQSGIPPASVQVYIDTLPEPDRTMAIMDFAATNYFRNNPLIDALMLANGMTNEEVDQFFIEAFVR